MNHGSPIRTAIRTLNAVRRRFVGRDYGCNVALSGVGGVAARTGGLLAMIVAARLLALDEFGQFALVYNTLSTLVMLAGAGLSMGLTTLGARAESDASRRDAVAVALGFAVPVALVASLLVATCGGTLAARVLDSPQLANAIRVGALFVACALVAQAAAGVAAGLGLFKSSALASLAGALALVASMAGGAANFGVRGAVVALAAAPLVTTLLLVFAFAGRSLLDGRSGRDSYVDGVRFMRAFMIPSVVNALVSLPATWYTSVMLARSTHGFDAVGVFNVAYQWFTVVVFVQTAVSPALLAELASASKGGSPRYWATVGRSMRTVGALGAAAAAAIALSSPWITGLYGSAFQAAVLPLVVMAAAGFLACLAASVGGVIATSSSLWWGAILNAIWAIALLAFARAFIGPAGALGLAAAFASAYVVHCVCAGTFLLAHRRRMVAPAAER